MNTVDIEPPATKADLNAAMGVLRLDLLKWLALQTLVILAGVAFLLHR